MEKPELYMQRALQLARLGQGLVAPNPLVGCVLVHPEHGIIGEGWHRAYGGPHAEIRALESVVHKEWVPECTAYVSLEPCSHFGKTPPCADRLIAEGIGKVVVCHADPHPLVSGKGMDKLEAAGIPTETGLLAEEGLAMNRFFIQALREKRPWITLKWAMTADGFVAESAHAPSEITQFPARVHVHRQRALHQAILVGKGTLRADNPMLNLRLWTGRQPVRVVLDPNGDLPSSLHVFQDPNCPTWVLGPERELQNPAVRFWKNLDFDPYNPAGLGKWLWENGLHSLYVEGGPTTQNRFFEQGVWDELHVYQAMKSFGKGIQAPRLPENARLQSMTKLGEDLLCVYRKSN